jgi:hypothetical protein
LNFPNRTVRLSVTRPAAAFRLLRAPLRAPLLTLLALACLAPALHAQEPPYFVTYSQVLEEPGNLEIAEKSLTAAPKDANSFLASTFEFEYGATAWWTTEVYLEGQSTSHESTIFTGYRWENRVRPIARNLPVNPVLYLEYEAINGATKSLLEVVGHDGIADLRPSNAEARGEVKHELETKLILSSFTRGWNFSENFIAEKNLAGDPWEFGYALGVSRPLSLIASGNACKFCRQNITGGAELFGGLGTVEGFGLHDTSHYAGPTVQLDLQRGPVFTFSPEFGLNDNSAGVLWRFKVSYEVQQFRDVLPALFRAPFRKAAR